MGTLFGIDRRVLALAVARMVDAIGNSFLIIVLPLYIESGLVSGNLVGLSQSVVIGIVLSAFGFLNSFSQPFTGRFSDRVGKRKIFILFGLGILAVTNFAYVYADTYLSLIGIRALQGIGVAFTIPCTIALVNELATKSTRGGNMGVFNTFRLAGFGAGPVAAGLIVNKGPYYLGEMEFSGFEAAFYLAAASAVIGIVMVQLMVSDPEETRAEAGDKIGISVFDKEGSRGFLDPVFTLGVATLFMAIGVALFATLENQVNTRLQQSAAIFGLQFSAFVIAQVFFQAPVGRLSDFFGRRSLIVYGMFLLIPATLIQGYVLEPWQMFGARFFQGVAGALVFAPALALVGDLAGEGESGTKLSILTMAFGLGTAIGPLSSGILVSYGFEVPFIFGAILAVFGAILVYTQVEETVEAEKSYREAFAEAKKDIKDKVNR